MHGRLAITAKLQKRHWHDLPANAIPDEITQALSFALRYDGRKRVHHADDAMARIPGDRLVRHLERSGFVLMKRSARAAPTIAEHMPRRPLTD
jgi:hypothetical protein